MSDTQYDTQDDTQDDQFAGGSPDGSAVEPTDQVDGLGTFSPEEVAQVTSSADVAAPTGGDDQTTTPEHSEAPLASGPDDDVAGGVPDAADTPPTADVEDEGDEGATPGARRGTRVSQLEREGEVAADFLETLLDIADLDGDIEVDIDGDRAAVSIVDSDEGRVPRRLVGQQGKVLEALQELTRLAVQTATGERSRLMLDVAGHRAERRTVLVAIAQAAIAQVKESGEKTSLDDMTAFERKVIHDEVAAAGLDSESEGVEPHRHIIILPA